MAPEVSICIPTYNQVRHLELLLRSIEKQTFSDFEIIISDDSTNNSVRELLKKFSFGDKLRYFHHSPSLGSPSNWNFALQQSRGDLIKIMHHDDYFTSPDSLLKFTDLLKNNPSADFGFSATRIEFVDSGLTKIHKCTRSQLTKIKTDPDVLFLRNYIGAPSTAIIRKKELCFFDEKLKWLVDVDWYMQLIKKNQNVVYINEPLVCTIHGAAEQTTQAVQKDKEIQVREHLYLFEKIKPDEMKRKKYSIFFQLLFHKYGIHSRNEILAVFPVNDIYRNYFETVLKKMKSMLFIKKVNYWSKRFTIGDYLLMLRKKLK